MKSPFSKMASLISQNTIQGQVNPNYQADEPAENDLSERKSNTFSVDEEEHEREKWSNPIEFLLSCIAMSVGLGNIWRFPFTAYNNGGGAFLIPYILVLILVGKPLYYMELCMGQFASYGSVKVWEMVPGLKGIGYGQAFATWCVVTYYVSIMALTVFYFFASFFPTLPWDTCGNHTNCIDYMTNHTGKDINMLRSSSEIYYEEEVLQFDHHGFDDGITPPVLHLTVCLFLSWLVLYLVLVKGVRSSGKIAYFTALFPYFVIAILLIRGATLKGALSGMWYFLTPQWSLLLTPKVWFEAVGQSFFSLSVGFGSITMFASYNGFRHNVYRDAFIISITDTLTSFLAGLTIFAILGHLADQLNVPISEVVKTGGSGLAFISYPDVIARFTVVPQFFSVLFFLMLFTLGVGSASALTACIITIICDKFQNLRKSVVTFVVCVAGFLLGLFYVTPQGQYILVIVDHYGGTFVIFLLALLEVIAVQWIYGMKNFIRDIEFMLERKTSIYWRFCWAVFIPLLLTVILIYTLIEHDALTMGEYVFGPGANGFGIFLTVAALSCVPIFFGVQYVKIRKQGKTIRQAFTLCFKASDQWSPKGIFMFKEYHEFTEKRRKQNIIDPKDYLEFSTAIEAKPSFHFKVFIKSAWKWLRCLFWED